MAVFIGMPGPIEMMIIAGMCGLPVILVPPVVWWQRLATT